MEAKHFKGVEGLFVVGQIKPAGTVAPLWILSYSPNTPYVSKQGGTPEDWIPTTEALAFSLSDKTYRINRGIDAKNDSGKVVRAVGDLVVDSFSTDDPIITFIRSQTRHMYVYANINHTCVSTGTFA